MIVAVAVAAVVAIVGLALTNAWLAFGGLGAATVFASCLALYLIVTERRRHEVVEVELSEQATVLESLVESMGRIAETLDADEILQRTCREAEHLFDAKASIVRPGGKANGAPAEKVVLMPLRVHGEEVGALRLSRERPFGRDDVVHAAVLADFAARASENARLLAEAKVREAERAQLSEQLITAEQDERRRLALFLHDGPVQSMSGIGLMLDAVTHSIEAGRLDEARRVLDAALERHRDTIRSLRDLSFNIEPVVLRDQGFGSAVRALADQVGLANQIQVEVEVDGAEVLAEKAQVGLYQIIREAVNQALRRGPPTRISIRVEQTEDGEIATEIVDDGAGERRRRTFESIEERARTLNGRVSIGAGDNGGTAVRVVVPAYAAEDES